MRKSIFYDKAKRSNKAKPDVSAWVKGVCTVHESKRFTAIFYWIALVACLAVICSAFADAGNISIDGYVQPGEWAGASFSTLFGSEQESGCAVSYADVRTQADVSARRVYFALQVIDGAFAGGSGRSRVHLRLGKAEITLDADGNAQTSGISYEVQAAGQYQPDGYNGDYVLEAAIICPAPLFTEDIAASIWFTDGKGDKSRVCELTIPLDIPAPSASESVLPQPDSPSVRPQPSTQADQTKQPSTQNNTHAEASHSSRPVGTTAVTASNTHWPSIPDAYSSNPSKAAGLATNVDSHIDAGGQGSLREPPGDAAGALSTNRLEDASLSSQELTIPATGENGAGLWSAKRIVACVTAGVCVLAAALLFLMRVHKKVEPSEG